MPTTELAPDFRTFGDKPTALLTGYTTVRGAELKELDKMIAEQGGDVPVSGFEDRFGRPELNGNGGKTLNTDHVDECLKFLQAVDFVEISAQSLISYYNGQAFSDLSFEARLLYHVRQQTARRRHFTYISEVLTGLDARRVPLERLLEEIQDDDRESFDLSWNVEKLRMWANLFDPLGAISYVSDGNEREIVASPSRALLAELITWYADHVSDGTSAAELLEWLDETFSPVFVERAGTPRLSIAVADTLRTMVDDGALRIVRESDTQSGVELPEAGGTTRIVSKLIFEETPDSAAYHYPLARTTRGAD